MSREHPLLSTQGRVFALLVLVVTLFLSGLFVLQRQQARQMVDLFDDRGHEAAGVLDRVMRMNERALTGHAADYSRWDDMVACVRDRDLGWARLNVDPNLDLFGYDHAWIVDPGLATVYAVDGEDAPALPEPPIDGTRCGELLAGDPFRHTFLRHQGRVLELWTAPIQPTGDTARSSTPAGYFVIAREWDADVLSELSRMVGGEAALLPAGAPRLEPRADVRTGVIEIDRPLGDVDGIPIATLRTTFRNTVFARASQAAWTTWLVIALLSLASAATVLIAVLRWVVTPLRRVREAMRRKDPGVLGAMVTREDEFGRLSELIVEFFAQRDALVSEVRERRRAELEAELQREFVRQVLDTDPDPVYVVDATDRFVLANEGAHRAFGAAPGSLPGRDVRAVLDPLGVGASFQQGRARAVDEWGPADSDERWALPDGTVRRYHSVRLPLLRPDGEALVLTLSTDVTERMREQHELMAAKEAAEAAVRARAQFLANISHELRTPMHGILSYARFGLREWGTAERDELRDFFQNIHESGGSLLALLNDLLDLAKLESGRMQFEFQPVDPCELVDAVLTEFEPLADERGLRLDGGGPAREPAPEMRADRAKLLQVLRNLVSNALKFAPPESAVEVAGEWNEHAVRISVLDRGPGVPEEERERIFDKFVQSGSGRSAEGGTGLGLAICREILDVHAGRIWMEPREGGGSVFRIEVPRADALAEDGEGSGADDGASHVDDRAA